MFIILSPEFDLAPASVLRPFLVILHRYVGLATALFLVVIGLTGSLLAYLHPLSVLLSPELYRAPARGAVLAPAVLAARAGAAEPRAVFDGWPLGYKAGEGVVFDVAPRDNPTMGQPFALGYDQLWLDPVSGTVLGRVDSQAVPPTRHSLMNFVYQLHETLALPDRWGTWIVGLVAILWFFDCFVGAALTFPRGRPFLRKWRPAWGIRKRRLNHDLHRAGGLWPWALLATLALSGVYFNLGREVFLPVFDRVATRTRDVFDTRPQFTPGELATRHVTPPDRAVTTAEKLATANRWPATARRVFHRRGQGFWEVYFDNDPSRWATAGTYRVYVDDVTGQLLGVRTPAGTRGDIFLDWLSALHVGGVGGAFYRIVLCGLGMTVAMLSGTGLVIWWRKRRARRHAFRRRLTKL